VAVWLAQILEACCFAGTSGGTDPSFPSCKPLPSIQRWCSCATVAVDVLDHKKEEYLLTGVCRSEAIWTYTGWWFGTMDFYDFPYDFSIQLGMSSSQLTSSYFSEGFKPPTSILHTHVFHSY